MAMVYEHFAGFASRLAAPLQDAASSLTLPEADTARLKERLRGDKYTTLRVSDGTNIEYVRVSGIGSDGDLTFERGREGTEARAFPAGSCVSWELAPSDVRDIVCQMECCD